MLTEQTALGILTLVTFIYNHQSVKAEHWAWVESISCQATACSSFKIRVWIPIYISLYLKLNKVKSYPLLCGTTDVAEKKTKASFSLHFEQRVAGDHVHLDAYPQHGIVLPAARVVALEQAAARRLTRARQFGQIHVAKAQLLVRSPTCKDIIWRWIIGSSKNKSGAIIVIKKKSSSI